MAFAFTQESPEERELQKRLSTSRRVKLLGGICVLVIGARFFIKDPPPPPPPDHSKSPTRISPGFLDTIPLSERSKLKPELLAQLEAAKRDGELAKASTIPGEPPPVQVAYVPPTPPPSVEEKKLKPGEISKSTFKTATRKTPPATPTMEKVAQSKTMLVLLRDGRFLKAQKVISEGNLVQIIMDGAIHLSLPRTMVRSISDNALTWKEPVPFNFVRLKPANGITVVVNKETAKRISVRGTTNDES